MYLGVAQLIEGTEIPIGSGVMGANRCVIYLPDGTHRTAIIKRVNQRELVAECFCAVLLRQWGLNVPEPYIVLTQNNLPFFGSADTNYPNLNHRLSIDQITDEKQRNAAIQVAADLVSEFSSTPLAIAIDEAINNRDRNFGNILFDGASAAWIDHAFALGSGSHLEDCNKLAIIVQLTKKKNAIARSAIAQALILSTNAVTLAADTVSKKLDPTIAVNFVHERLNSLTNKVISRFTPEEDLFSVPHE